MITGSYGSGSRRYNRVEWTVTAVIYGETDVMVDVSTIQTSLNAFSSLNQVRRPFTIADERLIQATYTLTLTLTNFLGLTSFNSVVVNVASDPNIPILSVIGPSYIEITVATALNVLSAVELSSCARLTTRVVYEWRLFNDDFEIAKISTSSDPRKYSLPPYSLSVGSTYTLTITATSGI